MALMKHFSEAAHLSRREQQLRLQKKETLASTSDAIDMTPCQGVG